MLTVSQGVRFGLIAQAAVLAALAGGGSLGLFGVAAGVTYGTGVVVLLGRALGRSGAGMMGPADVVTLARSAFVGGVAALVAESFAGSVNDVALVALGAVAFVLDGVDGRVARRTGTVSAVGARLDMEVDSVLVLVLGVYVAASIGPWVLAIGSVHYALVLARRVLPWLRAPVPPRYWCKVVAVVQGVVLLVAATGALPRPLAVLALVGVAALLAESFGREVWWLWRGHRVGGEVEPRAVGSVHA